MAKIVVDTTYHGWLINCAQSSNMIAKKHGVDMMKCGNFLMKFTNLLEIDLKCSLDLLEVTVIPNLSLIDNDSFWQIDKINNMYAKKVKNIESIAKKYVKGKQSYDK